jgi:excisionase family DNA binding protein
MKGRRAGGVGSGEAAGPTSLKRLALSRAEAAECLGVSVDFFVEHVEPEIKIVRVGRRRLVPASELQAYLDRFASRALEPWR